MSKKALVIGSGSLRGAYSAGVATVFGKELGPNYFDEFNLCSVGVYDGIFCATGQIDIIENFWRLDVSGRQLINFLNPLRGRNTLDLEYLDDKFRQGESRLDLERLSESETKLEICLTNAETGEPAYVGIDDGDLLTAMRASCAYPLLHPPVKFNGEYYLDGGLSDPLPVKRALDNGNEVVVAILPKPKSAATFLRKRTKFLRKFIMPYVGLSPKIMELIRDYENKRAGVEEALEDPRVKVIRPSEELPLRSMIDTNHSRINESFDLGVRDARDFLKRSEL